MKKMNNVQPNNQKPLHKVVTFLTGNDYKFREACKVLSRFDVVVEQEKNTEPIEIQSSDVGAVARFAAETASRTLGKPVIKVDSGLFITQLNGFPGVYTGSIEYSIKKDGILKLLEGVTDRSAVWRDALAFAVPDDSIEPVIFYSETPFEITEVARGDKSTWGLDGIMSPAGTGRTFAEMTFEERLQSWKTTVFVQLGEYLTTKE